MRYKFQNGTTKYPVKKDRIKRKLLQQFDEANLRLQGKCAGWLERKTAHWSRKSWVFILVVFTLFTSGYSMYVMVDSFSEPKDSAIPITPIVTPTNTIRTQNRLDQVKMAIRKSEYEKTVRFRKYMDSLGRSPNGKKIKDSINQNRPGLLDSVTIVEKYDHSQFKK
jgi:multidrug efflux pump subunit AcrB